ncbi:MAG: hypothetical protein NC078_06900, partial [Ruminococcus sp.]|nr:hypothetical protein [Ruminococcus sp.]
MVIQHNIPGLNSRRLYNKNSSSLAKSLEKLSSGYAVNRAADDAAGLAVSEKMRSQIAGMKQAVKNCADGISLIQTFEGALDETVTIIKRMKTLADQSANGTYDDPIDRNAIETEYLHLRDEIDQIADTDFNGIVMLNGKNSLDNPSADTAIERAVNRALSDSAINTRSASANTETVPIALSADNAAETLTASAKKAVKAMSRAVFSAPRAGGGVTCGDFTVYGDSGDFSFDTATGVLTILGGDVTVEGTGAATTNTIVVAKDKSAHVTLRNVNIDVRTTSSYACAFKIEDDSIGDVTVTLEGNNILKSGGNCAGLQKNGGVATGTLTLQGNGSLVALGELGAGIGGSNWQDSSNIVIVSGTITAKSHLEDKPDSGTGGGAGIGGGTVANGNNIKILGGIVNASSVYGAGIGGGGSGYGNNIIINGGVITAISYGTSWMNSGAGIGGGYSCGSSIIITGGEITATSMGYGAGIGGGACSYDDDSDITISGGKVIAVSKGKGAGIGSGANTTDFSDSTRIVIKGEQTYIIAKGGAGADNIGNGANGTGSKITIDKILVSEPYTEWEIVDGIVKLGEIIDGTIVHYTGGSLDPPSPDNPTIPATPDNPDKLIVSIPNAFGNAIAKMTCTDTLTLQAGARTKDSVNFT